MKAPEHRAAECGRPARVQLSRAKGWKMSENAVKVDRSTRWGNHFRVLACEDGSFEVRRNMDELWNAPEAVAESREGAIAAAVDLFREWAMGEFGRHFRSRVRSELRGKKLACWCSLDGPCHADVLLEIANRPVCEPITTHASEKTDEASF